MKRSIITLFITLLVSIGLTAWSGCGGGTDDGTGTITTSIPTGTGTGGPPPPPPGETENVDPSNGSGGDITPGDRNFDTKDAKTWECNAGSGEVGVYIPSSYDPSKLASPVIWLFNEALADWFDVADANALILVDLDEYNNEGALAQKINFAEPKLEAEYNVDRARYHYAGFSAGGNIAIIFTDRSQTHVAAALTFPGSMGGGPSMPEGRPNGAKYFYAVGSNDGAYKTAVPKDAQTRAGQGYTTTCDIVQGAGHYIPESQFHIRQKAWEWAKGFNLNN